jgi:hypothetical protein
MAKFGAILICTLLTSVIALTLIPKPTKAARLVFDPDVAAPADPEIPEPPIAFAPAQSLTPPVDHTDSLRTLHRDHTAVFAKVKPAGKQRMIALSHEPNNWPVKNTEWQIDRVELVGSIADKPIAYEVNHGRDMQTEKLVYELMKSKQKSSAAATNALTTKHTIRKLDEFESGALRKIAAGSDEVFRVVDNEVVMVGALRATKSCAACHRVPEGTLLGAFTYKLKAREVSPAIESGRLDF